MNRGYRAGQWLRRVTGQRWDPIEIEGTPHSFLVHVLECGHVAWTFLRRDLYADDHPVMVRELRAKRRACHPCYTESVT